MSSQEKDRKLEEKYENPIDNLFIKFGRHLYKIFKKLNLTANHLTMIRLITGLYSVYELSNDNYTKASLLYIISYFFDCIDGPYARQFDMVSGYGDKLDHFSDWLVNFLIIKLILMKQKYDNIIIIIGILLFIGMNSFIAAQEKMVKDEKNKSETLKISNNFDLFNCIPIKYLRWLGPGTFTIFISTVIYNL
jgi:phosphatidylglycerophosphate synthase